MDNTRCCVCNKPEATTCSTCNSASYCSDQFMKDDECTHNLLCASFAAFNKTRPTNSAILALYFPITTYGQKGLSAPKIVWVDPQHEMHIVERRTGGGMKYTDPLEYDPVELADGQPEYVSNPVEARDFDIGDNYAKNFTLHPVFLRTRDFFTYSRLNLALIEIAREQLHFDWWGPLILYSKKDFSEWSGFQDVTLSDFRSLLDFCKVYRRSARGLMDPCRRNYLIELEMTNPSLFATILLHSSRNRTFQGVEIRCLGDKIHLKMKPFDAVAVPAPHPIFDDVNNNGVSIIDSMTTEVSKMIELPLLIRCLLPDKAWYRPGSMQPMCSNPVAEYLNINTDIRCTDWGFPDRGFPKGNVFGRLLVVREDLLAITARQVEAVCAYFKKVSEDLQKEMKARLRGVLGRHLCEGRAKLMAEHVSRFQFETFFNEFKEQKVKRGDISWKDEVSPYEVVAEESGDDDLGSEMHALDLGSDSERVELE